MLIAMIAMMMIGLIYDVVVAIFFISTKRLQYEFTSYTTLQDYCTIQVYNTTGTIPRGAKDYDYLETN